MHRAGSFFAIPVGAGLPANTGKAGALHRATCFAGTSGRRTAGSYRESSQPIPSAFLHFSLKGAFHA